MYQHILVPTDGTALSTSAVTNAVSLAKTMGAKVTVLTVVHRLPEMALGGSYTYMDEYRRHAQADAERRLSDAEQKAKREGVSCDAVKVEDRQPFEAIIETAEARGCDLIVMASHGPRGITALLIGSETMKVLTHSKIPVLVYR
ncbi:universal stress protein [Methylorubrum extorquens]|uniref:universal stress protein n=1 Tax=Methylorubrum extorquens TaxID=408 RepID=UPI0020A1CF7D|nr:universal stress protein [Methylorubrum extorquens]MCP1539774.1 nucleotide-binding universal stress UspA family protein [Methylorubrum extorquens]